MISYQCISIQLFPWRGWEDKLFTTALVTSLAATAKPKRVGAVWASGHAAAAARRSAQASKAAAASLSSWDMIRGLLKLHKWSLKMSIFQLSPFSKSSFRVPCQSSITPPCGSLLHLERVAAPCLPGVLHRRLEQHLSQRCLGTRLVCCLARKLRQREDRVATLQVLEKSRGRKDADERNMEFATYEYKQGISRIGWKLHQNWYISLHLQCAIHQVALHSLCLTGWNGVQIDQKRQVSTVSWSASGPRMTLSCRNKSLASCLISWPDMPTSKINL